MNKEKLLAGAGTAEVAIDAHCLPIEGFETVHDVLHVRALIFDSGRRSVIVSVEITSIFPPTQKRFEEAIYRITGAAREDVWLCLTHSFSGPHIWPSDGKGPPREPEELARCRRLEDAYVCALETALRAALDDMRPALLGAAQGDSAAAVSRNVETEAGWWLGADPNGPCDRTLTVLRIDGEDGGPIALLFCYGVRSECASESRQVSSDLCGGASVRVEKALGCPALFLCGACADQTPARAGDALALNDLSAALAEDVLALHRSVTEKSAVPPQGECVPLRCPAKRMERDRKALHPSRTAEFIPDGEKTTTLYALRLGAATLVGVQPEISGVTAGQIAAALPEEVVAVCTMVNGGDKCMPERRAYELVQFPCLNSPFMPGAAEQLRDAAVALVKKLKERSV